MRDRRKKKPLWLIPVGAGVIAAAAVGFLIWTALKEPDGTADYGSDDDADETDTGIIMWNGRKYRYNDHLSNYLLIGVDNAEVTESTTGEANAGQADAIYLLSMDRLEKNVTVISIPRDTMSEIQLYGPGGKDLGTSEDHISLSYAYGDGSYESCELTKDAVSNLFYGLPIQSSCSVSMDAMPVLTGTVETLTVTVPNDSLEAADPVFAEGENVTLTPENTEFFLRYRDTDITQSALARLERQQAFLRAYGEAAKEKAAAEPDFAVDLYTALEPYLVTTMGKGEFVQLAQSAAAGQTEEGWTVPGEGVQGSSYDEYHVDDEALYGKIIETFYEEAE